MDRCASTARYLGFEGFDVLQEEVYEASDFERLFSSIPSLETLALPLVYWKNLDAQ